ncbi:MAG: cation diffusion facilitator family transporter [Ectothiorhodospiraceae bacterium]|nr:cation diffusion facilitator family transporter [Ectothiorhodospiraceae bacterium]
MRYFFLRENTSLMVSAAFAAVFAAAGIGWGLWMGSLMILFDGAYSLVSLLLSLLAIQAGRLVRRPGNVRFPFGYAALQPLVIAVKGIAIMLVCLLSFASAVRALVTGGTDIQTGMALLFTAINVVGCGICLLYLRWVLVRQRTDLVHAEYQQWSMDTLLSAAVLAGFAAAFGLEQTRWAGLAVYADPVMVILVSGYFVLVPLRMTIGALRELLLAAPPHELQVQVERALNNLGLDRKQARVTKLGPYLLIELSVARRHKTSKGAVRFGRYRRLAGLPVRPVVLVRTASAQGDVWPSLETPGRRGG